MEVAKTVVSKKGQVVIPKEAREELGLVPSTVLEVHVEGKRIILEPLHEPPREAFVEAGPKRLLRDLGVQVG